MDMMTSNQERSEGNAFAASVMISDSHQRRPSSAGQDALEMATSATSTRVFPLVLTKSADVPMMMGLGRITRRTLGICLLLVTVVLWTLSNFLASLIFSDHTYDKPFFLVYSNTSVFAFSLLPMFVKYIAEHGVQGLRNDLLQLWTECQRRESYTKAASHDDEHDQVLVGENGSSRRASQSLQEKLTFRETAVLSFEFCMLWFLANYFASACLEYTSVASVTILTSTSSVWTLVFCALFRVEAFSLRKLIGVTASLVGIVFISTVDLAGESDENRGSFPHKTPRQIAIGDAMAFFSAILYGVYVTVMKRRVGNEDKVNMRLFFGMVGLFNLALLWPLFFILHWTNVEPFQLPPSGKIWAVIIINSIASFVSDISWALAMLLTSPLVVTVGLSLTIPLSLVGEIIQYGQYSSFVYWIGAAVVFASFVFINHESQGECDKQDDYSSDPCAVDE